MFRPRVHFLDPALIQRILDEALAVLQDPGITFHWDPALQLLADAGAEVNFESQTVHIPENVVFHALDSVPREFFLYNAQGEPRVRYGGDAIHFDPGSSALWMYDAATRDFREPETHDFVQYARLADQLPAFDAVSTAFVCREVPGEIADLYRLYLLLRCSDKPIVTGAFAVETFSVMRELLGIAAGSASDLAAKPRAVFDVCPTPPLRWSENTAANIIEGAQHGIPMEFISMPLSGAAAPVTLIGSVVQHLAENLSGIVLSQCARPGAPIVFGGAPSIFDMRMGLTPLAALESTLMTCSYVQIGKSFNLPTHGYLGLSDTKVPDMQAGWETGMSAVLGALAGTNMMSGAGLLDCAGAFSLEKMVADTEVIAMARRAAEGIAPVQDGAMSVELLRAVGPGGTFLDSEHTYNRYRIDHLQHSTVVDRVTRRTWQQAGGLDTFARAHARVQKLLAELPPRPEDQAIVQELEAVVTRETKKYGMNQLPPFA